MLFIKESGKLTREDSEYLSRYKELEEAMEHFDKLSQEEKLQQAALDKYLTELTHELDRQGIEEEKEQAIQQSLQQGIKQGLQQGRKEVILSML